MFYDKFAQLCRERDIPPTKAAIEAGINKSAVTYWKNNKNAKPTGQIAERLCAYFGITMSELYGDIEKAPTPEVGDERNPLAEELTSAANNLSDEQLKFLLAQIRVMKEQGLK